MLVFACWCRCCFRCYLPYRSVCSLVERIFKCQGGKLLWFEPWSLTVRQPFWLTIWWHDFHLCWILFFIGLFIACLWFDRIDLLRITHWKSKESVCLSLGMDLHGWNRRFCPWAVAFLVSNSKFHCTRSCRLGPSFVHRSLKHIDMIVWWLIYVIVSLALVFLSLGSLGAWSCPFARHPMTLHPVPRRVRQRQCKEGCKRRRYACFCYNR